MSGSMEEWNAHVLCFMLLTKWIFTFHMPIFTSAEIKVDVDYHAYIRHALMSHGVGRSVSLGYSFPGLMMISEHVSIASGRMSSAAPFFWDTFDWGGYKSTVISLPPNDKVGLESTSASI
jgi:hypothetical protein